MNTKFFFISCCILIFSAMAFGQIENKSLNETNNIMRTFKPKNPTENKNDIYDITGSKSAVFTVSNVSDGSAESYNHSLKITIGLVTTNTKSLPVQLVFYSGGKGQAYSVLEADGFLTVYFPIEVYESIKQKLDEYFSLKKTVQLKITITSTGYREGTLIF